MHSPWAMRGAGPDTTPPTQALVAYTTTNQTALAEAVREAAAILKHAACLALQSIDGPSPPDAAQGRDDLLDVLAELEPRLQALIRSRSEQ